MTLQELHSRLGGEIHHPGTPAYDEACTLFNAMIERRPRLIVHCSAPADIAGALAYARQHGLEVAVRGGGHSVAGMSLCDDGLVVDVRGLRELEVDPVRRVARVGAGLTWADVDRATEEHGLATTGGRVSSTGVAGLTLGGGSGWLERKHGLTCDNVLAVELVTAAGELVRASAQEHPDLFWALRGGGGNFGVVTAFELALHPVGPEVLAGLVLHPAERGRELLALYRDAISAAPDELSLAFVYLTAPAEPEIPEALHGRPAVAIAGMHAGSIGEGEEALAAIRGFGPPAADLFEPMSYAAFQCALDDPPGYRNWWTAEHLRDLHDGAIEAIARRAEQMPAGPSQLFIVAWGGAVGRVAEDATPIGCRDAAFVVHPFALWDDAAADAAMIDWARGFRAALGPWATGGVYLNFVGDEGDGRVRAGFGERNYERLARVKAAWDPENVFRGNQNVRPAAA